MSLDGTENVSFYTSSNYISFPRIAMNDLLIDEMASNSYNDKNISLRK